MKVRIEKTELKHEGGTKRYAVYLIHYPFTDRSVVVTNWGRVKTRGQCKIQEFRTGFYNIARTEARKAVEKKGARGYFEDYRDEVTVEPTFDGLASYVRLDAVHLRKIESALGIGEGASKPRRVSTSETKSEPSEPEKSFDPKPLAWGTW